MIRIHIIMTAVVEKISEINNCKLCNLVTHYVFYRAAILGIGLWVVIICHCNGGITCYNPTGNCYHLLQTHVHVEAEFLINKSHECGVLNSLLPDDLIEAVICMRIYCHASSRSLVTSI